MHFCNTFLLRFLLYACMTCKLWDLSIFWNTIWLNMTIIRNSNIEVEHELLLHFRQCHCMYMCRCRDSIEEAWYKWLFQWQQQHAKLHVDMVSLGRHHLLWRKHTQPRMRLYARYELFLAVVLLVLFLQMLPSQKTRWEKQV